jgi:hypothetical protein
LKPAGGLDFFAGLTSHDPKIPGYGYNRAFETILLKDLVSRSAARAQDSTITPPMAYGSHRSRLIQCLTDKNHAGPVKLSPDDRLRLVMWIDTNAPYHDRFVNKRPAEPPYDLAADQPLRRSLEQIHGRRCRTCHNAAEITRLDWIDPRDARRSLFVTAPLRKCKPAVYRDTSDTDYQAVMKLLESALHQAWSHPRRDLESFPDRPAVAAGR